MPKLVSKDSILFKSLISDIFSDISLENCDQLDGSMVENLQNSAKSLNIEVVDYQVSLSVNKFFVTKIFWSFS